ncbi:MAG: protein-disulfide reductase DsbD [Gammaproteobacteria bacterium]|nr:protein-disulfide reductase DsbD [Gammaproteobacteria bacterium]
MHPYYKLKVLLFTLLGFLLSSPAFAVDNLLDDLGLGGDDGILEVDEAFKLSTGIEDNRFVARWEIAEGHYLYQDKMDIVTATEKVETHPMQLKPGEEKHDPIFNKLLYVYHDSAEVSLPIANTNGAEAAVFKVKYQGCSEISGICYPPQTREISVRLPEIVGAAAAATDDAASPSGEDMVSEQDRIANTLKQGDTWITLLVFFGAGLLLALTPCVFPMIPILMGIIVGQGENQTVRSTFILSLVYVLAMALTYTVVGILVGLSGENIQAWFQNPWVISAFVAIFIALSFSMFGFYELQMPASIQSKITQISNSQRGGTLTGVAIMGFLSALIVGPCVTAPLVGALIYIAETGDAVLGGLALFSLSMGMGAPLIAIGASAGKILPKAGPWMDAVKAVFGVLLLGLGIWMLERVAPPALTMALWAALLIVSAVYMGAIDTLPEGASGWRKLWKGGGLLLLVYGIVLIIGLASGGRDVFHPLKNIGLSGGTGSEQSSHLAFRQIKGVDGLNAALADARAQGKTVMLDFYADWCISCKEMEALTFTDPRVQQALADTVLLQADVTPNDEQDVALYKHFGIIGPPSIMFFDKNGNERKNYRVVGFVPADKFSEHVKRALN